MLQRCTVTDDPGSVVKMILPSKPNIRASGEEEEGNEVGPRRALFVAGGEYLGKRKTT